MPSTYVTSFAGRARAPATAAVLMAIILNACGNSTRHSSNADASSTTIEITTTQPPIAVSYVSEPDADHSAATNPTTLEATIAATATTARSIVTVAAAAPTTSSKPSTTQPQPPAPDTSTSDNFLAVGIVTGMVVAGPRCPVVTAERPCPDIPVSGRVTAMTPSGRSAGSAQSDAVGHYYLTVPPGTYVLNVTGGNFSRCATPSVIVTTGTSVSITISCDTGIR